MPNWCENTLTVRGKAEDVALLKEAVSSDTCVFSFNRVVPMPERLNNGGPCLPDDDAAMQALGWAEKIKAPLTVKAEKLFERLHVLPALHLKPEAETYFLNAQETGYLSWYSWSIEHWGTKWDAQYSSLVEETPVKLVYSFETAWDFPAPIYKALSKMFPNVKITAKGKNENGSAESVSYKGETLLSYRLKTFEYKSITTIKAEYNKHCKALSLQNPLAKIRFDVKNDKKQTYSVVYEKGKKG